MRIGTSIQLRSTNPYAYEAKAIDPEGSTVSYQLVKGPEGLTLDATSGTLNWPAAKASVGEHAVSIQASDGDGGTAKQDYVIKVESL